MFWWIPLLLILGSCSRSEETPGEVSETSPPPWVIIKSGESPLWFELGPDGPVHIADPADAAQEPWTPWRLSRHTAGMALSEGVLTMAVNRMGFLVCVLQNSGPSGDTIALYRAAEPRWADYTLAALFSYRETPMALLYRDDFFIDSGAPLPESRFWRWEKGSPRLSRVELAAFAGLPAAEGWDIEALSQGRDGLWYYRGVQKNRSPPEPFFFRTTDLEEPGERIAAGVFRDAVIPYTKDSLPPVFQAIMLEAGKEGAAPVIALVSADFPVLRYYAGEAAGEAVELAGFYQSGSMGLAMYDDGRILYSPGLDAPVGTYTLPELPEGFVYTRLCLLGKTLFAAWEEQDGLAVGAAGFMVIVFSPK